MPCDPLRDPRTGEVIGFACTRGRRKPATCSVCRARPGTRLCDGPSRGRGPGRTCDAPLCSGCAVRTLPLVGPR